MELDENVRRPRHYRKKCLKYWSQKSKRALEDRFAEIDGNCRVQSVKGNRLRCRKTASAIFIFPVQPDMVTTTSGRETLEQVYADVFHTEDALVRPQIVCGTHALHTRH